MIYVVATVNIHVGKRAAFLAGARAVIAATVKEAGCVSYDLHESITHPQRFVFVERWETREALGAHCKAPHLGDWRKVGAEAVIDRVVEIVHADKIETL